MTPTILSVFIVQPVLDDAISGEVAVAGSDLFHVHNEAVLFLFLLRVLRVYDWLGNSVCREHITTSGLHLLKVVIQMSV